MNTKERPAYMNKLNRKEASAIFKARTRMLDIKNNFRNKYHSLECRGCKATIETQQHIMNECGSIHITDSSKVTNTDIFTEDPKQLRNTAWKIFTIMEKLQQSECQSAHDSAQPGKPG